MKKGDCGFSGANLLEYQLQGNSKPIEALKEINMTGNSEIRPIRRGEFVMLRGPSGCGKTTLLNILGTIDRATSGEIREPFFIKEVVICHL